MFHIGSHHRHRSGPASPTPKAHSRRLVADECFSTVLRPCWNSQCQTSMEANPLMLNLSKATAHIKSLSHISHGTIMHGQEHVDHQKKVPFIQTHHVAGSQAFRGRLMTQQMPTKRRTKPVQVQKIVKVHPHTFAIFFNRLSISMCFGLTRLSFAIENQTDKAPVLVYSFATSAETSTTIQSHLSGQQMNFWTRGFPKTRTSRACSANVQHTSTDTD